VNVKNEMPIGSSTAAILICDACSASSATLTLATKKFAYLK